MTTITPTNVTEAFEYLRDRIPSELRSPTIGIICGSGLGGLAETVHPQRRWEIAYKDIPHFPPSQGNLGSV